MDNGWQSSADAWVADMGASGDFGRRYVLDPVMPRAVAGAPRNALDVGGAGLTLTHFDEPAASPDAPASRAARYARVPWFLVMEWMKPPAEGG